MRVVLQRVERANVQVAEDKIAEIRHGLVILLGIGPQDGDSQARYLTEKIANLRVFEDQAGKTNLSILDVQGAAIVVSQFTLYADTGRGRRPSFVGAASPAYAQPLVARFAELLVEQGVPTQVGRFGAHMKVDLINDGPFTIWIERE